MKHARLLILVALMAWPVAAQEAIPQTDEQKILYAVGLALANQVQAFDLDADDMKMVQRGLADAVLGREEIVDLQVYGPKINELLVARTGRLAERQRTAGSKFTTTEAGKDGAVVTDSGMIYFEQELGSGPQPSAESAVTIHYTGTFIDGEVFDTSRASNEPVTFELQRVVPCFREGLMRMKVGGKSRLVCPSGIAYGDRGNPPIPPGATIVFEVELVSIGTPNRPADAGARPGD